jgi:hypothetical protein
VLDLNYIEISKKANIIFRALSVNYNLPELFSEIEIEKTVVEKIVELEEMAFTADKVIDLVSKVITQDYNGCPKLLDPMLKKIKILRDSIKHEDNLELLISCIKAKISSGTLSRTLNNCTNLDELERKLINNCKGEPSWNIKTELGGLKPEKGKDDYIDKITKVAEKLQVAFINENNTSETAEKYVVLEVQNNIKFNYANNKILVSAMNQDFNSVEAVIQKFRAVHNDRDAQVMIIKNARGFSNRGNFSGNPRGNFRGNHRGNFRNNYNNYQGNGNYQNSQFRSNNSQYSQNNQFRGNYQPTQFRGRGRPTNNNNYSRNNIRAIQSEQGNAQDPQNSLGETNH